MKTYFATKMGMTSKFDEEGVWRGLTAVRLEKMKVKGHKTLDKDGYEAVIVEFSLNKRVKKREIKGMDEKPEVGAELGIEEVNVGDKYDVQGISRGKGFAGAVKRHGFAGGPRTHGQSDRERAPGSSGSTTTPGRVFKGTRRAGRMGGDTVSVRGLRVVAVDAEKNLVYLRGAVPGHKNTLLRMRKV